MPQPRLYKYVELLGKVHEITAATDQGTQVLLDNGYCYSREEAIRRYFSAPQANEKN